MSFTKTVFFNSSATSEVTLAVPAADGGISIAINDTLQANGYATVLAAGNTFQLVNGFYSSPRLKFNDLVSAKKSAYSAGTAQILTATIVAESDGTGYVKLIDVTDGREKFNIKTFEATGTAAEIATALRASILLDENVSATGGSTSAVQITFVKDVVFRAAANAASSIAYTGGSNTAMVHSIGAAATVKAELAEGMAFKGVTNQGGTNIVSPDFATAVNSDVIRLEFVSTVGDREDRHEVVFYAKTGGAGNGKSYDDLGTIFDAD
tara:strand:- start:13883 stop:14680 length:798 start_codon:yes stop_codon:yes gene_type:complete